MENPITKCGMAGTPENMEHLEDYIQGLSRSEKVIAWTCAMMAWNLASKIVDEAIAEEKGD